MIRANPHYQKLNTDYLFSEIAQRIQAFQARRPDTALIHLGLGDVTGPLPAACIRALHAAVDELSCRDGFRGYGPEQGYGFLREAIAQHDFRVRGAPICADEIFISEGTKVDIGNIQALFATDLRVAIPDPVYPVYVDTNVMAGRTGPATGGRYSGLTYLPCTAANGFVPEIPDTPVDLIYLCSPNNPTGVALRREQLQAWVDHARAHQALILFDAAYEAFIRDSSLPHSIYEIPGAREVAIEFRSYSKTAGFTGVRCAYTVVPKDCIVRHLDGTPASAHALWRRRHQTRSNGVSYFAQRAAQALYTPEGRRQARALCDQYLANARTLRTGFQQLGLPCTGGEHSPYVWIDTGQDAWAFFDLLLDQAGIVCTPGSGFGRCGQRHIRLSAFNSAENTAEALERIAQVLA